MRAGLPVETPLDAAEADLGARVGQLVLFLRRGVSYESWTHLEYGVAVVEAADQQRLAVRGGRIGQQSTRARRRDSLYRERLREDGGMS